MHQKCLQHPVISAPRAAITRDYSDELSGAILAPLAVVTVYLCVMFAFISYSDYRSRVFLVLVYLSVCIFISTALYLSIYALSLIFQIFAL